MSGISRPAPCNTGNVRSHPACCFPHWPHRWLALVPSSRNTYPFHLSRGFHYSPWTENISCFSAFVASSQHPSLGRYNSKSFSYDSWTFFPPPGRVFRNALLLTGNPKSPRNVTSQKGKRGPELLEVKAASASNTKGLGTTRVSERYWLLLYYLHVLFPRRPLGGSASGGVVSWYAEE